jgi:hypothetical protein
MSAKLVDMTGQKIGKLTILSLAGKEDRKYLWNVECDCGNK